MNWLGAPKVEPNSREGACVEYHAGYRDGRPTGSYLRSRAYGTNRENR